MKGSWQKVASQLLVIFASFSVVTIVRCNKCTSVLSKNEIKEVVLKVPCVQKYEARCGWLSLNYCTFYHQTYCDKHKNETVKTYYIHTDCCEGYVMARNGSCVKKQPGMVYQTTPSAARFSVDPNFVANPLSQKATEKKENLDISAGGYAGIACGVVLLAVIIGFIVIAVLKKKRRKKQKSDTAQEVQYVGSPTGSVAVVRNSGSTGSTPVVRNPGNTRSPSMQLSISPTSSRMVTPPTSPVKSAYAPTEMHLLNSSKSSSSSSPAKLFSTPAAEPLLAPDISLHNGVNLDIPESDI